MRRTRDSELGVYRWYGIGMILYGMVSYNHPGLTRKKDPPINHSQRQQHNDFFGDRDARADMGVVTGLFDLLPLL